MFSRRTIFKARYELIFIRLSLLVIVGIGLLPKSPPPPVALETTAAMVVPTPAPENN